MEADEPEEDTQKQHAKPDGILRQSADAAMASYRRELERLTPELRREVILGHVFEQLCLIEPEFADAGQVPSSIRALLELATTALVGAMRPFSYDRPEFSAQATQARRSLQQSYTKQEKQTLSAFFLESIANSGAKDERFVAAQLLRNLELVTGAKLICSVESALGKATVAVETWSASGGARLSRPRKRWDALNELLGVFGLGERSGESLRQSVTRVREG